MTSFDESSRTVEQAARNNALWCDAVCRVHGRPGEFHETLWLNHHGTPEFYPDAVTLADAQDASDQMRVISDLIETSQARAWAVKDSFGDLDLAGLGFEVLFEAEWIGLDPGLSNVVGASPDHQWADVLGDEELAAWERAWKGSGEPSGDMPSARTFLPSLLQEADIRFVSVLRENRIVGGGILNRGAGVVGLSNCFTLDASPEDVWRGLVSRAHHAFPGQTLVGYETDADLDTACRIGFEKKGKLRVWCTPD